LETGLLSGSGKRLNLPVYEDMLLALIREQYPTQFSLIFQSV